MSDEFSRDPMAPRAKPPETGFSEDVFARPHWRDDIPGEMPFEAVMKSPQMKAETEAILDRAAIADEFPATASLPPDVVARVGNHGSAILQTKMVFEWKFVNYFLKAGGFTLLLFATIMLATSVILLFVRGRIGERPESNIGLGVMFVIVFGGMGCAGVWFAFLRKPPAALRVWYLKAGIVCHYGDVAYMVPWTGLELISSTRPTHINIGILFPFGVERVWFWIFNTRSNRRALASIEVIASATNLPLVVHGLACGRVLVFGKWSISATEFMPWADPMKWDGIEGIDESGSTIIIRRRAKGNVKINVGELPFPSLFLALARGLIAYSHNEARQSREAGTP